MSEPNQGPDTRREEEAASEALRSEVAQKMSLESIRYSTVWEDYRLLVEGLQVRPDDDLLVIASSGDNALALLLEEPRSLVAIDMSPAQTALMELKLAAIRHLEHVEFVALLGIQDPRPAPLACISKGVRAKSPVPSAPQQGLAPVAIYKRLRSTLPDAAIDFWDANHDVLRSGILQSGRLDTYFRTFQTEHLPDLWASDLVRRLFAAPDLASQAALFEGEAFTAAFQERFRWYFGRHMMATNGRDPAQFEYVIEGDVGDYFLGRFHDVCTRLPLRGNFYVERFLTGTCADPGHATPSVRPDEFTRLKDLVDRVQVVTGELEQHLTETTARPYSKVALSDIFEYMSEDAANSLFAALSATMRPGGRLAYWNLLVPRWRPASLADRLHPLKDEAHRLWLQDRAWFYRAFHLEEILS